MNAMQRLKLGGVLLTVSTAVVLLSKVYRLISIDTYPFGPIHQIFSAVFGSLYAMIIMPNFITSGDMPFEFSGLSLLWAPWAGLVVAFLLYVGISTIRERVKSGFMPVLIILALWYFVAMVYGKIRFGFIDLESPVSEIFHYLLSDLTPLGMIIGMILIVLNHRVVTERVQDSSTKQASMSLSYILFSFDGRINRARFWQYQVGLLNIIFLGVVAIAAVASDGEAVITAYFITFIILLWPGIAIGVKRCHDRNRPGAFVLLSVVPLISLWYVVEVLFLKGTQGDNRYGADPLQKPLAVDVTPDTHAEQPAND